jgi:hypothetical protein
MTVSTPKCVETRADCVVAKSNGMGDLLSVNMHPRCLFKIVHNDVKKTYYSSTVTVIRRHGHGHGHGHGEGTISAIMDIGNGMENAFPFSRCC